jgi:hypothetical protein
VGTGTRMINADFLIIWPNPTSYTLSHRTAPYGHAEPDTEETTQTGISIVPALSTNASSGTPYTQIAILRELAPTYRTSAANTDLKRATRQQVVFAYSRSNPKSASVTASIEQHDQGMYGAINMDLSQPLTFATNDEGEAEVVPPPAQPQETIVGSSAALDRSDDRVGRMDASRHFDCSPRFVWCAGLAAHLARHGSARPFGP